MHAAQAGQSLEIEGGVAHGQVAAFDQRIAELARQVQVFEVAFVETPRREQHHQRCLAAARRLACQGVLQGTEETGQVLHPQVAVQLGESARDDLPVLQCITGAGRRLGTVGSDPPATVRRPGQIHRVQVQPGAARRLHALTGPEEVVVPEHQLGRQQPFGDQFLRPVEIGQDAVEHGCPLRHTGGDLLPFVSRNQVGQQVEFPGPVGTLGVGVDVVGDAILLNLPGQHGFALRQVLRATACQLVEQTAPVRTHVALGVEQFVVGPGRGRVIG